MFLSNKLEALDTYQPDCHEFTVLRKGSTNYLTDRFELYTDQEKRIFNHIDGAIPITKRIGSILLKDNKTITSLIQSLPDNSENYWTKINDKRLALYLILKKQKKIYNKKIKPN